MYETILVPVDGSDDSEDAVSRAIAIARATNATIHPLFVVETANIALVTDEEMESFRETLEQRGRDTLAAATDRIEDAEIAAVQEMREGVPHRVIDNVAGSVDADLIVMGTRGLTATTDGRAGSTTERVITFVDVPVLSVPAHGQPWDVDDPIGPNRIVIPIDGSDNANRTAEHAIELATYADATVDVLYVIDESIVTVQDAPRSIIGLLREGGEAAIDDVKRDAQERELAVSGEVLRGVPETEILSYANGVDADVIAMGTRGIGGGDDRILGSTTARVLRRSDRPVLTIG